MDPYKRRVTTAINFKITDNAVLAVLPRFVGYPQTYPHGTSGVALASIMYHSEGKIPQSFW
jgi:hypothetical protein